MNNLEILKSGDIKAIINLFTEEDRIVSHEECASQYDVNQHRIFDKNFRPDKIIYKDVIVNGEIQLDENGNAKTVQDIVPVTRIGEPFQAYIVEQRVGFMTSNPINYNLLATDEDGNKLIERVKYILDKNNINLSNKDVLRRQMSEMECARFWYFVPEKEGADTKLTLKCKILSPALGDTLMVLRDNYNNWIAFARKYKIKEDNKEIECCDVHTSENSRYYINKNNEWQLNDIFDSKGNKITNPIPNPVGKIMVTLFSQDLPEWYPVESMTERHEVCVSNHGDMNDYFGSPILAVSGTVTGFLAKGTQGQILTLEQEARANYLQLTTPPESILKEQDRLRELIFALSNTADISFDKVKGIGNLSAIALNLLFISSTMAAKVKEEKFALSLQKEISLIMNAVVKVIDTSLYKGLLSVTCNPEIKVYAPKDDIEFNKMLGLAVQDGIMSQEQAVELNDLVINKQEEIALLKTSNIINNKLVTNDDTEVFTSSMTK